MGRGAALLLYYNCLPDVMWLLVFVALPRGTTVGRQCVIVVFPDYTHGLDAH